MSPKRDKTVPELVEKYRRVFPSLESRYLRRLIRAEHPELFKNNSSWASNLRKLSRYLKKAFETNKPTLGEKACSGYIQPKLSEKERELLLLDVECYALREEMFMDEDKYNSEAPEERAKRRQKYRELFKLS